VVNIRKNGERDVHHCKDSDGDGDSDGHCLMDRKKNITRPAKKKNTEKRRSFGTVSTARDMSYFRVPRNKNERTRARSLAKVETCGIWIYLRAHC